MHLLTVSGVPFHCKVQDRTPPQTICVFDPLTNCCGHGANKGVLSWVGKLRTEQTISLLQNEFLGSMQLLAASGEPLYCKIRDRHTATYQTCFFHPAKLQWALSRPMKYWSWQESGELSNLGFSFVRDSFPNVGKLLFPTFGRHRGAIFRHNHLLRTPLLRFWNFRQHTILC